jgi:nucleoside phosphorylase
MNRANARSGIWPRGAVAAVLAAVLCACGGTVVENGSPPPFFAVLSAFPAETAPLLEHASVDDTMMFNGKVFRIGRLGGVHVAIGLTGIGLLNAANTTRAVLDGLPVTGIVFSGVAGSSLRIADVAVPVAWSFKDGTTYPSHQAWLDLAAQLTPPGVVPFEHCTVVPASGKSVCLPFEPAISVGGVGLSSDTFGKTPFACQPTGNDVFGCDVAAGTTAGASADDRRSLGGAAAAAAEPPIVEDMETAAVAREAAARGIPFIGFRSVSDGAGDPLGLPGFPTQFFAYYRLAGRNAAAATIAFLERVAAVGP